MHWMRRSAGCATALLLWAAACAKSGQEAEPATGAKLGPALDKAAQGVSKGAEKGAQGVKQGARKGAEGAKKGLEKGAQGVKKGADAVGKALGAR